MSVIQSTLYGRVYFVKSFFIIFFDFPLNVDFQPKNKEDICALARFFLAGYYGVK
ncbi:hypothetical protein ES707_14396 [subsurface metagenome]